MNRNRSFILGLAFSAITIGTVIAASLYGIRGDRAMGHSVTRTRANVSSGAQKPFAMRVWYEGTGQADGPTIAVNVSTKDISITTNGTTADTTVGDGDANATDGVIDVSNGAYDTIGEVCDDIDESANWVCSIVEVPPSEGSTGLEALIETDSDGFTSDSQWTDSAGGLFTDEGLPLLYSPVTADAIYAGLHPGITDGDFIPSESLADRRPQPLDTSLQRWKADLDYVEATCAYTSGNPVLRVYAVMREGPLGSNAGAYEQIVYEDQFTTTGQTLTIDRSGLSKLEFPRGSWPIVGIVDESTPDISDGRVRVTGRIWNVR